MRRQRHPAATTPPPSGRLYFRVADPLTLLPYAVDVLGVQPELVPQPYAIIGDPAISPDGRTLAFEESFHIVLHDLTTGRTRDITIGQYVDTRLTWSPDGRSILVLREPFGAQPRKLVLLNADGSGERVLFAFADAMSVFGIGWSADGQWAYVRVGDPPQPRTSVYRIAVNSPAQTLELVATGPNIRWAESYATGQVAVLRPNPRFDSLEVALYHPAMQTYSSVGWFAVVPGSVGWPLAWSPDGRYIAVVWGRGNNIDNHLLLFDVATRRLHSDRLIEKFPEGPGFSWGPWPVP